jgi:hypothetical protein
VGALSASAWSVVLMGCGADLTGFARWTGCVAEASTAAARAFVALGGYVPVYLKFAVGAGDCSLDTLVTAVLVSVGKACAAADCYIDAGHASHLFARSRSYYSAAQASVRAVS